MPHEPKVGELPLRAWLVERESNCERLDGEWPGDGWREDAAYFGAAIKSLDALEAEREARKDEARDAARWREQQTHRQALYGPTHWKRYVEFIDRRIELHAAALQAEHGAAARDGEAG